VKDKNYVFADPVAHIAKAISDVEGHAFGSHFRFASLSYAWSERQLHHSLDGGWKVVPGFHSLPGLDQLAEELNAAIKPVMEKYAVTLRQALANECTKLGAAALKPPTISR
jgi:hypothetical protein